MSRGRYRQPAVDNPDATWRCPYCRTLIARLSLDPDGVPLVARHRVLGDLYTTQRPSPSAIAEWVGRCSRCGQALKATWVQRPGRWSCRVEPLPEVDYDDNDDNDDPGDHPG